MRCLLLAVVAGLAVLSVQICAEDVAIVDDFEIDDSTLRQMLGDLFEFDESDDLGIDRDARAEEEKAIAVDPKEQVRYNSFIDTFLRRLNSFARSRFDPLSVGLGKKGKSSSKGGKNKKGKNAKSGNKKGKKGGNKKSGKKDKKSDKKKGRHPKDLDLDVHEGEEAVVAVEEEEEDEVHEVEKREAEFEVVEIEEEEEDEEADLEEEEDEAEEGSLVRVARDADEEADDSPMKETSRRLKPAKRGKKGATKKGGKKSGKKGKGTKKSGKKGGKNKKGKKEKSGDKKGKKSGKKGKKGEKKNVRHPKDLDLEGVVQEAQEAVVDVAEEKEVHEVEKREAEFEVVEIEEEEEEETDLEEKEDEAEEDSLVRVARDADEETDDSPMEETSRRRKPAKGSKKGATKKGGKKGGKKGKGKKKSGKKDGKKSGKKSGKKGRTGGKKKGGHTKALDLDEVVQEGEEAVVDLEEEEGHEVEKREAELEVTEIEEEEEEEDDEAEEDSLVRVARDAEEETDDSPMEETSRRGKPDKGGKKGATKKGGKKSGKKGKGKKKSGKQGGKKSGKKSGKNSKRSAKNKSGPRTSRADVSGIATLIRDGDVLVRNKKGGKEMRATFTMGPVQLKVNRKFGSGKKAISREAAAISPELTGKLAIVVAANGKARMTNFRINRPAIVQVQGTLAKTAQGGKSDNNFMENSIGRFSPIASKKLKLASREILSAAESKANADN